MGGGSLSDDQLKEFDAYLNSNDNSVSAPAPQAPPVSDPEPVAAPEPPAAPAPAPRVSDDYLDQIVSLHEKKAEAIIGLLDKIDAKSHKDIVADLVDEMQYQKGVVKREREQSGNLKKLFSLANEASKK
ncbi:MAG: hypothetical protein LBC95_00060 [Candidatus Nomurabacteria bacterium]|jgi:hypothetical protein|nr:hypothetical protein [Candidatus Nomurabacteria bacterium]